MGHGPPVIYTQVLNRNLKIASELTTLYIINNTKYDYEHCFTVLEMTKGEQKM